MLRVTVLGSGSSGNSTVVECGQTRLLIDAGFSAKKLSEKLQAADIDPDSLSGILITHEHTDHVQALPVFTRKWGIPVYITRHTHASLPSCAEETRWIFFESGHSFSIGDVIITSFPIPHDAADPVGFRFDYKGRCYGHLSDVGNITREIRTHLEGVHALFLESNYDPDLLQSDTKRPWPVKQRICSHHGHLSNLQAGEFICELLHTRLEHIILGHLSRDCNTPELALKSMRTILSGIAPTAPSVHCSTADEACPWVTLLAESSENAYY